MTFTLTSWMIYTLWAIFGLMIIDFLIGFIRSFWAGSFETTFLDSFEGYPLLCFSIEHYYNLDSNRPYALDACGRIFRWRN